ncbi:MAG: SDR family oxidoreductase [Chloroherpetonaceae bacterium]|nr:SDR family oxidoreductase [Chloroherpetonaceae bacterium]
MSSQKIALVTGANKGIGLETVKQLAEKGVKVYLGSRDEARGQKAAESLRALGLDVTFVPLDMTNPAHFSALKSMLESSHGRLDILVNNAGIQIEDHTWSKNTTSTISQEILRETFETNFFGLVHLTHTLLPLIRKSDAGRIVNLTSILGSLTLHATPGSPIYETKTFAYNTSKAALNMYTIHLAHELQGTNIRVNAAHPGWVKTDMGTDAAPMNVTEGSKTSVDLALAGKDSPNGKYLHLESELPW